MAILLSDVLSWNQTKSFQSAWGSALTLLIERLQGLPLHCACWDGVLLQRASYRERSAHSAESLMNTFERLEETRLL